MKKGILITLVTAGLLYCLGCNSGEPAGHAISSNPAAIAKGEVSFTKNCGGCHNFKQGGIGPSLGGITDAVPAEWIQHFIRGPQQMAGSGDQRAQQLLKKYRTAMPPFASFTDDELNEIIAFLNTHKKKHAYAADNNGPELINPIPDSIERSNLTVGLQLFAQIPASSPNGKAPLARITKLDVEPYTDHLFVLDLRGKLYRMQKNSPLVYLDMAKLKPKFISEPGLATGFGSFAFHPDFAKNGLFYTAHAEAAGSAKADFAYADSIKVSLQWVVTEWKADNPRAAAFSGTNRELLRANMVDVIHGIQEISFNPLAKAGDKDYGMLYIGVGDGGSVDQGYPFLPHNKHNIWGTILRIDPRGHNSSNGQYGIPPDNPFVQDKDSKTRAEIYAWGFRNPHRITWSRSGQMLACNIGGENIESVYLIVPGNDYGWPIREGRFVLNPYGDLSKVYALPSNDSIYKISYPVAQYDHDGAVTAISGGLDYWSDSIKPLKGKFLFGDIPSGRLFFLEMADIKQGKQATIKEFGLSVQGVPKTLKELCGNDRVEVRFGRGANGEIYLLTKADGKLYKIISAVNNSSGNP
jgi:mono/diheme cytochrome c family protein